MIITSLLNGFKYGAEQLNDVKCLYGLGIYYDDGIGVKKDTEKADTLFRQALPALLEQAKQQNIMLCLF